MLLFVSGLVHVRVRVVLVAMPMFVIVLDVLMLVGRMGVRVGLVSVLVLVFMDRFVRVLGHRVS